MAYYLIYPLQFLNLKLLSSCQWLGLSYVHHPGFPTITQMHFHWLLPQYYNRKAVCDQIILCQLQFTELLGADVDLHTLHSGIHCWGPGGRGKQIIQHPFTATQALEKAWTVSFCLRVIFESLFSSGKGIDVKPVFFFSPLFLIPTCERALFDLYLFCRDWTSDSMSWAMLRSHLKLLAVSYYTLPELAVKMFLTYLGVENRMGRTTSQWCFVQLPDNASPGRIFLTGKIEWSYRSLKLLNNFKTGDCS